MSAGDTLVTMASPVKTSAQHERVLSPLLDEAFKGKGSMEIRLEARNTQAKAMMQNVLQKPQAQPGASASRIPAWCTLTWRVAAWRTSVWRKALCTLLALVLALGHALHAANAQPLVMASTTSTEQSGLFAHLLPAFTRASGIAVKVVALGTGQALDAARRGDADVVFVHDRAAEEAFVAQGYALKRQDVMYNDFVLVGQIDDPAAVRGSDIVQALQRIAAKHAVFFSRGDKSGTHAAELRYWQLAGVHDRAGKGDNYKECGCGMGQALNMAAAAGTYVLTDRGTWLNFKNRRQLTILVQGDKRLFNQYGVMAVNPAKHPHVQAKQAQAFVDWVTSGAGQAAIADYKINGESVFFPNAKP